MREGRPGGAQEGTWEELGNNGMRQLTVIAAEKHISELRDLTRMAIREADIAKQRLDLEVKARERAEGDIIEHKKKREMLMRALAENKRAMTKLEEKFDTCKRQLKERLQDTELLLNANQELKAEREMLMKKVEDYTGFRDRVHRQQHELTTLEEDLKKAVREKEARALELAELRAAKEETELKMRERQREMEAQASMLTQEAVVRSSQLSEMNTELRALREERVGNLNTIAADRRHLIKLEYDNGELKTQVERLEGLLNEIQVRLGVAERMTAHSKLFLSNLARADYNIDPLTSFGNASHATTVQRTVQEAKAARHALATIEALANSLSQTESGETGVATDGTQTSDGESNSEPPSGRQKSDHVPVVIRLKMALLASSNQVLRRQVANELRERLESEKAWLEDSHAFEQHIFGQIRAMQREEARYKTRVAGILRKLKNDIQETKEIVNALATWQHAVGSRLAILDVRFSRRKNRATQVNEALMKPWLMYINRLPPVVSDEGKSQLERKKIFRTIVNIYAHKVSVLEHFPVSTKGGNGPELNQIDNVFDTCSLYFKSVYGHFDDDPTQAKLEEFLSNMRAHLDDLKVHTFARFCNVALPPYNNSTFHWAVEVIHCVMKLMGVNWRGVFREWEQGMTAIPESIAAEVVCNVWNVSSPDLVPMYKGKVELLLKQSRSGPVIDLDAFIAVLIQEYMLGTCPIYPLYKPRRLLDSAGHSVRASPQRPPVRM